MVEIDGDGWRLAENAPVRSPPTLTIRHTGGVAGVGIRVNTVCPGMVKTPLNRSVWKSWRDRDPIQNTLEYDEWADQKIKDLIPLGEWQQPDDVADMILFLSSRRAAQVTGQTINVDGGYVMHW